MAMWDVTTGTWSALGSSTANGTSGLVNALAVSGSDLYVGGYFAQAGGINVNHIAMWNSGSRMVCTWQWHNRSRYGLWPPVGVICTWAAISHRRVE